MLLSQIISKDLMLHQKGNSRYEALCPWHSDSHPSLQIHDGKNLFKCFVCGKGGKGAISYIMLSRDISYKEAIQLLKTDYNSLDLENDTIFQEEVEYCLPKDRFKKPSFKHYLYNSPTNVYEYRNYEGRLLGYCCRYSTEDNGKIVLPYNYILVNGSEEWVFKGFKTLSLPYKAELIYKYPKATIVIVEGEKAVDCGLKNSKGLIFISWVGGSNAVKNTDWSSLKDRHVILIPDHDKEARDNKGELLSIENRPGNRAMIEIAQTIQRIASKIEFIVIPEEYPNKWDIADRTWKPGDLRLWINKYKQNYFKLKLKNGNK